MRGFPKVTQGSEDTESPLLLFPPQPQRCLIVLPLIPRITYRQSSGGFVTHCAFLNLEPEPFPWSFLNHPLALSFSESFQGTQEQMFIFLPLLYLPASLVIIKERN